MPSQTVDFLYAPAAALAGLYLSLVSNVDGVTKYSATTTSDTFGKWAINPKPPAGTYALYTGAAQGALTTLVDPDFVVDPFNDDGSAVFPKQVTVAGNLVLTGGPGLILAQGAGQFLIVGGTTGVLFANNANSVANVSWNDAGLMTVRGGLNVTAGGVNITAGGLTVSAGATVLQGTTIAAGGLTVSAGGAAITGNSVVTGTLNVSSLLTAAGIRSADVDIGSAGQLQIGAALATSIAMRAPQKALIVGTALTALGAGAQTLTAAALFGGEIEHTVTGAVADTFDTGTNLDAAVPNVATGDSFTCILTVLGAFTVTLTAAAGITLRGTAAVAGTAAGKVCVLTMRRTGVNAWTVYAATGA